MSTTQSLTIASTPPVTAPPVTAPPVTAPPATAATYRPDAEIRWGKRAFTGKGSYSASRQRVTAALKGRGAKSTTFQVRVVNRGTVADQMTIRGARKNKKFTVVYLAGRKNVTAAVLAGRYRTKTLQPGRSVTLTVRVTKRARVSVGSKRTFAIRVTSAHDRTKVDTVSPVGRAVRG